MPKIIVERKFLHCVRGAIYPTVFLPSTEPIEVDDETAAIATKEGWARLPFTQAQRGPQSLDSGPEAPSVALPAARASTRSKSKPSGGGGSRKKKGASS